MVIQLHCVSYKSSLDLHWSWTWACWLLFCVNPKELLFCDPAVEANGSPLPPREASASVSGIVFGLAFDPSSEVSQLPFHLEGSKARSANLAKDAAEPLGRLDVVDSDGLKESHMQVLLQPLAQPLVSSLVDQCCGPCGVEAYSGSVRSLEAPGGGVEAFGGLGNVLTNQGLWVFVCPNLNLVIGLRA